MQQFHVRISKEDLVFRVAAEVHGPLDENHYVVDFLALRDTLRTIIAELDHRVLLPTGHPLIRVAEDHEEVEVTWAERRWTFPRSDCLLLPIPNTTAELLARYLGQRLLEELTSRTGKRPALVRIEVEESPGFSAVCQLGQQ
jgi:6-pyruvoyltetrahydropterin/6-carboxytetrahydropterin synthase